MERTVLDIVLEAFPVLAIVLAIVMLPLLSDGPPKRFERRARETDQQ